MDAQRKFTQVVLVIVTIILLAAFVSASKAEELYNYKVYGQNKKTGLVVAGKVWEKDKEGNVTAKIWDEFEIQEQCQGSWVGYGVAQVSCKNGAEYVLEVVEE